MISAFSGTSFSTAIISGFSEGLNLGEEIKEVVQETADTIPTEVSAVWLNVRPLNSRDASCFDRKLLTPCSISEIASGLLSGYLQCFQLSTFYNSIHSYLRALD